MIVLDASVALKWFVDGEPLVNEARDVLVDIEHDPAPYLVPDLFMAELLAVLARVPRMSRRRLQETIGLIESLGLARVGNGRELLAKAADFACRWRLSGYDALYVALAALVGGTWLTADGQAARRIPRRKLVTVLGA